MIFCLIIFLIFPRRCSKVFAQTRPHGGDPDDSNSGNPDDPDSQSQHNLGANPPSKAVQAIPLSEVPQDTKQEWSKLRGQFMQKVRATTEYVITTSLYPPIRLPN